jgi:hypothetical protein
MPNYPTINKMELPTTMVLIVALALWTAMFPAIAAIVIPWTKNPQCFNEA